MLALRVFPPLPLWPAYDRGCIQLGISLPRKNQTLLTSVDLPITFKITTVTTAVAVTAAINIPLTSPPTLACLPSLLFHSPPMAVNTKDKSVINYLQMITYSLQLFASPMAMPSTAAQMHQPSLAGQLPTQLQLPPDCLRKNQATEPQASRICMAFHNCRLPTSLLLLLLASHGETG